MQNHATQTENESLALWIGANLPLHMKACPSTAGLYGYTRPTVDLKETRRHARNVWNRKSWKPITDEQWSIILEGIDARIDALR